VKAASFLMLFYAIPLPPHSSLRYSPNPFRDSLHSSQYLHPHEKATFEILAASSLHSQEFLAPLRFQLSELVGKCLAEVSTVLEPEFEFQRDRKGAKELVNCAEMLLMRRIPKRGINFTLDAYDGKVDSEKNTVQTERTFIVIDGNQRYNKHYKIKPGSLLSGKAISSNYMALRVELLVKDLARKAAQEVRQMQRAA